MKEFRFFWLVGFVMALTAPVQGAPRQMLPGHVPEAVSRLQSTGRLPATNRLALAIGLPLHNQAALTGLLQQLYDPASTNYHRYLAPEEFTAKFGPTEQDYQAVISFAEANGLTVTGRHPNRMLLDVNGSAANIETAFQINLRLYPHPTEARTFYSPDAAPSVAAGVPVLSVSGLNNYTRPHPKYLVRTPASQTAQVTPASGSGPGGNYMGNDFRAAYAPGVTLTGAGQTVGLLQFDGYYASDITAYETQAGLPHVPLQTVLLDGYNGNPTAAGNAEVSLDIEMAISMAPGLSKVILYEAGPNGIPNDILNRMATDNLAKQISCSWGWGGGPDGTADQIFQQMAAQGQSFYDASGDSDAFFGNTSSQFPSDDPYITQVGGTTLTTTGPGGTWVSETVWNWGGGTGSSGGISTIYAIPSWQQGLNMSANKGSTSKRNLPDVALTADNVWVLYGNGSSGSFGGTSCAAPLWAGFTALINQQATGAGKPTVGFVNPALYTIGKGAGYASDFHDTTTGNNFNSGSPNLFPAVSGYDLCTGWGTPVGQNLINALAPLVNAPVVVAGGYTLMTESCAPGNGAVDPGETVQVGFGLQNVGSLNTTNLIATLLATNGVTTPSGPQTYGVLSTNGTAISRPFTFTAAGTCGGVITAALQLQDGATNLGTVTVTLPLGAVGTNFAEKFDGVTAPSLPPAWTTSASGAQSAWVTQTSTVNSAPNAAFSPDPSNTGLNELDSPAITLPAGQSQLSFANSFDLEASSPNPGLGYDGGVLEIKIGAGAWTDLVAAGGSFASGGYTRTISTAYQNPLAGRSAWSGNSGGFITTVANLPAAAAGQTIQLRWLCGSDNSVSRSGWQIDTIAISSPVCCAGSAADLAIGQSVFPALVNLDSSVTFTLYVTNRGPNTANNVVVADTLPAGLGFVSAIPAAVSTNAGVSTFFLGTLASGAYAAITFQAATTAAGSLTNVATVSSGASDPVGSNNSASASVAVNSPPTISAIPDVATSENTAAGPIGFVIGDAQTPASALTLAAVSSNTNLVPAANIVFGGSGSNRTVTVTPAPNQSGVATITVTVSDGMASTNASFVLAVNTPPTLAPIPDQTVVETTLLTFTNAAYDPDAPPQTLTFGLDPNAPAGAAVNATNGVFTWTPTEAQGPGTNVIHLWVADNGTPPISATQSFRVIVLESNLPPVLAAIFPRTIELGMTLVITNSATDPDIPANALTFSLAAGAPSGAVINATNGVFTWTPSQAQDQSVNSITVVVTDDGIPPLSDAKTFSVIVGPWPMIEAVSVSNDAATVSWSTVAGRSYRLQYIDSLKDTNWTDISGDVMAGGPSASKIAVVGNSPQRFYRVMLVP